MFAQARWAAERTPDNRNRAVDFYRAVAIMFVILGHWLLVAAVMRNGKVDMVILLTEQRWTHYATWLFRLCQSFSLLVDRAGYGGLVGHAPDLGHHIYGVSHSDGPDLCPVRGRESCEKYRYPWPLAGIDRRIDNLLRAGDNGPEWAGH